MTTVLLSLDVITKGQAFQRGPDPKVIEVSVRMFHLL